MINPWAILGFVLWTLMAITGGGLYGMHYEHISLTDKAQKEKIEAVAAALNQERDQQEKVNDILKKQNDDLSSINATLRADIDRLRSRKARPVTMPEAPRPGCEGTTGAELYREDALFLSGEAARADRLRSALAACYAYADTVGGQVK